MEVKCKTEDYLNLSDLTEFQGGLKTRSADDFAKIEKSIKKYGFAFPFFVWKNNNKNYVLDGHGRFGALSRMVARGEKLPPLPVVYVDCENEEAARNLLLRLNSHYGQMTNDSVMEFMNGFEINIEDLALPSGTLDLHIKQEEIETQNDEEAPEVDEESEPDSKIGEIYELGDHLLMCGSATEEENIKRLLNGKKANLVLTDPPYGISVVQNNSVGGGKVCKVHSYEKIIGDDTTDTARESYQIYSKLSENQIIFGGNYFTDFLKPSKCWLVWDKENTGNFADVELAWASFDKSAKLYKWLWNGMSRQGNRTDEGKTRVHPTQKPAGMLAEILKDFSKENDIVLDTFGGSGSTLIACAMTDRVCRMTELSPHYCDVIRKRWTQWAKKNNKEVGSGGLE